ncbi:MAG: diaminopimelate decarboxylase [Gammaproteobacteria bacterium]|nr:MAG: diaminopimelate decarboxylase [Gammaproteobacteria bacterium]
MKHTAYKNEQLHLENISLEEIAKEIQTPFYCYSQTSIEQAYLSYKDNLKELNFMICYAVKANTNQAVIKTLADVGAGADVVSEGELRRALKAGVPAEKIVYSGVAKTKHEIIFALGKNIFQFNVESENELELLNKLAKQSNKVAAIAFRINPDIDANTHEKISTGKAENKFGIPISKAREIYARAAKLSNIKIQGVDVHIGSQLTDLEPFKKTFERIKLLVSELDDDGIKIDVIDVGGGLGVNYENKKDISHGIEDYCKMLVEIFSTSHCKILLEPGRSIVADSGLLVSKVVYKKQGEERTFLIIDAAMNDLLRPSMYDAYHDIYSITKKHQTETYDVVGPVCETGDTFARNRTMAKMDEGDLLVIASVGAYGSVMSSTYNTRLLIPEILVKNDQYSIIKARRTYEELIDQDQLANWQS